MLSNFQTDSRCLLQTFLLGQPEFRATLHSPGMQQLRQRVIASYHLGPMDAQETRAYIEHRLATVGWKGNPSFSDEAHAAIFAYSGGIPRKTNTLCDRIMLMGYLEELAAFSAADVETVVRDIRDEFELPQQEPAAAPPLAVQAAPAASIDERMTHIEHSVVSMLSLLKNMVSTPRGAFAQPVDGAQ
jgi:hypothetical protein